MPTHGAAAGSLATKIILFVFASTFATAIVVSWVSIEFTTDSLRGSIDRLYPRELEHAERQIEPWLDAARRELTQRARESNGVSPTWR